MNAKPVLASINSRRQADVIISRLRQVGIGCEKISAVFPRRIMPTAVACWTHFRQHFDFSVGRERIRAVGPLPAGFPGGGKRASVADLIERCNIEHGAGCFVASRLKRGQILLCVHAENEAETSIAWHIFRQYMASLILVGGGRPARHAQDAEPMLASA